MYKELKVTLSALVLLHALVKCSKLIKKVAQEDVPPYDYCQRIGICAEGTHVMCTHYNPNITMGPLCTGSRNVSINPEYAKLLLDLLNVIRSRTALGRSAGLANLTLARGYGMFKLHWDPELSMIAQVWANTCTIGEDTCRATELFPDPGQVLGLTRFDKDWIPLNAKSQFNYTGFSLEKVKYGIHSTVRSWYRSRVNVHPDDILDDNLIWPKYLTSNSFLKIVHSRSTHVGCGISTFVEFDYHTSEEHSVHLFHNVVRVVCNLSSRLLSTPRKDRVYATEPPKQMGYTVRCGCPFGYDEDEYCLCYVRHRRLSLPLEVKEKKRPAAVAVLPIFTVENAPPSKISNSTSEFRHESSRKMMQNEVHDTRPRRHDLRGSIFLKPSVFELPPRKLKTNSKNGGIRLFKNDVNPRRNFTNVRRLVSKYLNERRRTNILENDVKDSDKTVVTVPLKLHNISKVSHVNNIKKENFEDPSRRRIVNDNYTLTSNTNIDLRSSNSRLINLLSKLEEEAKFVQLACDRKNELDHKIRKIYGTFLEHTFSSRKSGNVIEVTEKLVNFDDFLENDRLHKYEKQFNTIREKDQERFIFDENPIHSKQRLKNNNSFTYNHNHDTLEIKNIHGLRNNENTKREELKDFNNENSLSRREDVLTVEKRKSYQNKLNNLERRLRDFHNNRNRNKVQAKNNEILDLNSFFGSWERRHIQDLRDNQLRRRDPTESIETEKAEFADFRRRRQKENRKVSSKNKKLKSPKKSIKLAEKQKKRKKNRKSKNNRRFVKTTLNEVDRDSTMSDSKDSDKKGKPVDIVVHIKMND